MIENKNKESYLLRYQVHILNITFRVFHIKVVLSLKVRNKIVKLKAIAEAFDMDCSIRLWEYLHQVLFPESKDSHPFQYLKLDKLLQQG